MTYKGHVANGAVVLDEPLALPEGATVEVALSDESQPDAPALRESILAFAGKFTGLPSDASVNAEHYLYGHPKQ